MGETLKQRAALWLGLGKVWVELEALSLRLRRLERAHHHLDVPPPPKLTIPAYPPPPPPETGVRAKPDDLEVSDDPTLRLGRNRQNRGQS